MTLYAEQYIPEEDIALFWQIRRSVENMGYLDLGVDEDGKPIILSCHMLARAVARVFSVSVRDGYFVGNFEHSWVETSSGNIIDLYPIAAIGGPIMFDGMILPEMKIYIRSSTRRISRGRFGRNSFKRSVRRVASALEFLRDRTKS